MHGADRDRESTSRARRDFSAITALYLLVRAPEEGYEDSCIVHGLRAPAPAYATPSCRQPVDEMMAYKPVSSTMPYWERRFKEEREGGRRGEGAGWKGRALTFPLVMVRP